MLKQIIFNETNHVTDLLAALTALDERSDVGSLILFSCDDNAYPIAPLNSALQQLSKPIMGGIFPQILHGNQAYTQGFVLIGLSEALTVGVVHGLSDTQVDYETEIGDLFHGIADAPTLFVFVDGLAKRIASLVDGLYANFGTQPRYLGGGAGSLSFIQKPCLYTQQGIVMNAAVVGMFSSETALGVGHGWQTIVPDLQITQVDRNVVQEINYKPAFEVYAQLVNAHSRTPIHADNFFSIAQSFPFGINKLDGEKVVRDPIAVTPEGHLVCVGELSQGDYVDLLTAQPEDLIRAAQLTAQTSMTSLGNRQHQLSLLIDCISRALFLKEEFDQEVLAVRRVTGEQIPLVGALVLGEIANSGSGYLEFYNKTSVVGLL